MEKTGGLSASGHKLSILNRKKRWIPSHNQLVGVRVRDATNYFPYGRNINLEE